MGERLPKPMCSTQLGADWIDKGTMCRSRSSPPGPIGLRSRHMGAQDNIGEESWWSLPSTSSSALKSAKRSPAMSVVQQPHPATVLSKTTVKVLKNAQVDIAVFVEVVQDGHSQDADMKGAQTSRDTSGVHWKTPSIEYQAKGGREVVTKLTSPLEFKGTIIIQTVYGPNVTPNQPSGYGRGTTPEDVKSGNTSLGFHESCHRADYLQFLKSHPLPTFNGKVGMSREEYRRAERRFQQQIEDYFQQMDRDTFSRTDEVGYKKSEYDKKGPLL